MTLDEFRAARPPFLIQYWGDGEFLGEIYFTEERHGQNLSEVYLCPVCQQVWGLIDYPNRHWIIEHVPCRQHKFLSEEPWYDVPGSMLSRWLFEGELDTYPEAFIRREFFVHLENAEKELAT